MTHTMGNDYEYSETQLDQALAMNKMLTDEVDKGIDVVKRTMLIELVVIVVLAVFLAVSSVGIQVETETT